jgi:histidinol-phosphate aminotransferase
VGALGGDRGRAGIAPEDVLRFDGTRRPSPSDGAAGDDRRALARIQSYRHGGFRSSWAIADYNGVEPENIVLGAGADDILMLCARAYAGPGDRVAIADEPSYPLYRVAAWVTGADVGDDGPVLTFVCRPHNPSGAMVDIPAARPLVVDEAYFEYGGQTAIPLIGDGVIVVRTFSKAFGLASARVGYALADVELAAELNDRQQPAPISTLGAALALAGLAAGPPDVSATIAERERLSDGLRAIGFEPLPSYTNRT